MCRSVRSSRRSTSSRRCRATSRPSSGATTVASTSTRSTSGGTRRTHCPSVELALNFGRIKDDVIDEALDANRGETDPAEKKEYAETVNKRFGEQCYNLWGSYTVWGLAHTPEGPRHRRLRGAVRESRLPGQRHRRVVINVARSGSSSRSTQQCPRSRPKGRDLVSISNRTSKGSNVHRSPSRSRRAGLGLTAALLAFGLIAAACGSDDSESGSGTTAGGGRGHDRGRRRGHHRGVEPHACARAASSSSASRPTPAAPGRRRSSRARRRAT